MQFAGHVLLGTLFIYLFDMRRNRRLQTVFAALADNWRMLLFDLVIFIGLSVLFAVYVIEPKTPKEAFLAGATWEAAALSAFAGSPSGRPRRKGNGNS
jgi:hypothetical protein